MERKRKRAKKENQDNVTTKKGRGEEKRGRGEGGERRGEERGSYMIS